jgi:hypothetical protein
MERGTIMLSEITIEANLQNSPELKLLDDAYSAVRSDAEVLIAAMTETQAAFRPAPAAWTIAECLDHLAVTNRGYLAAMRLAADSARRAKRFRRRPALPSFLGGWFVRSLEPPAKLKTRAPQAIKPRTAPTLADASAAFLASHAAAQNFLRANADLDLAAIRFTNPFIGFLRLSLSTAIHIIPAHERRHLHQARAVLSASQTKPT